MTQRFAEAAIARLATGHKENAATIAIPSLMNSSGERGDAAQEEVWTRMGPHPDADGTPTGRPTRHQPG